MKCPFCGDQESKVVDSRHSEDGLSIRRRRECLACQRRFTTYEVVESLPIIVVKRDGSRQAFDRNKIIKSMVRAFDKRQVETADLDRITTEIEQTIQNSLEREVSTDRIGEMVMERIKPLDEVAYIRFASVYPAAGVALTLALQLIPALSISTDFVLGFFVGFAMPTAGLASVFSDQYNGDTPHAVIFTLGTTIVSIITIPVLYWVLCMIV